MTDRSTGERLLIACARPAATTESSSEVADLALFPDMPWTLTAWSAGWHGIAPRLARTLVVSGVAAAVPYDLRERLEAAYLRTMARNLELRRELERVIDELHRHDVEVMLLKGAALVPLVHHDPGVRPMDDLDLLVHHDDLALADRTIRALGYFASASPPVADTGRGSGRTHFAHHHLPALVRADGTVTIELHHKLGSSGSAPDFDVSGLWARAQPCSAGEEPCLRPSNEDLLAHVCLHFLVDRVRLFSRRALAQLCDIAATLDTFADSIAWDTFTRDAVDRDYALALALALGTTAAVLDVRPPDAVVSALAPGSMLAPDVGATVARRVLRDSSWTTLERLTSRQPSVRHLLPPNPRRWLPSARKARPPFGMLEGYQRWGQSASRILLRRGEAAAERRFAADLQARAYPQGIPDGTRPLWERVLRSG